MTSETIVLSEGSKVTLLLFLKTCNELLYSKRFYRRLSSSNVPERELTQMIFKAKNLQKQAPTIDQTQKAQESLWLDIVECMLLTGMAAPETPIKKNNLKKLVDLFPDNIAQRILQEINDKIFEQDPAGLAARRSLNDERLDPQAPLVAITLRCCIELLTEECQKIKDKIQDNYAGNLVIGDFLDRLNQPFDDLLQDSPLMTIHAMSYLPYLNQSLDSNDPEYIRDLYQSTLISSIGYALYYDQIKKLELKCDAQKSPENQGKHQSYAEDPI